MEARIEVEGAALLRRNLRKVHQDLPKGMKLIHQELAGPIAAVAKRKARYLTGRMAGTIQPRSTATMARVQAGPLVYVPIQHWGWPGHNIEPNRFLTDAIGERQGETLRLYEQKLGEWIEQVWVNS
jgi:hypothetical protein